MSALRPAPDQSGRTVVVTGANSGTGREAAKWFASAGARVVLAVRNPAKGADALAEIEAAAPDARAEVRVLDLADLASVRAFADGLARDLDRLDVLVNNAGGMQHFGEFGATSSSDWKRTFELNLFSAVEVTRAALPLLKASKGAIVNIASDVGRRAFGMGPDYCAAKAGLLSLTQYLAAELAPDVRVNAVCPGPVVTGAWPKAAVRRAAARTLLGRTGTPEEVAEAVLFAAHDRFLTGATVGVDGGSVRSP